MNRSDAPDGDERAERLRRDVAAVRRRDPVSGREQLLAAVGVAAMLGGIAVGIVAVSGSHATTNPLTQRDYTIVAIVGLTVSVCGAALFLRYSLARFGRLWLARLLVEQRAQTDRLLDVRPAGPDADAHAEGPPEP
ncbi:MAG: hypothetical protein IPM45_03405 [Acidimicrobiales bacterium]|nr:hypothetical protein [Acidimicrobiales bacterium]